MAETARRRGIGLEQAGREMRYDFLRQVARDIGAGRIATAHNADDNAETILFHLTRGSGLRGLGGIPPVRGELIRPLLTTTRREILDYLAHHSLPHMEDSSNDSDDYARNRIRHQVIPVLEELYPGFLARTADTASLLRADESCLNRLAEHIAGQAALEEGQLSIPAAPLAQAPDPVATRALRLLLGRVWGGDQDCGSAHLWAMLQLCRGRPPRPRSTSPTGTPPGGSTSCCGWSPAGAHPPGGRPRPSPGAGDPRPLDRHLRRRALRRTAPGPVGLLAGPVRRPRPAGPAPPDRRPADPAGAAGQDRKKMDDRGEGAPLPAGRPPRLRVRRTAGRRGRSGPRPGLSAQAGRPAWHITVSPAEGAFT